MINMINNAIGISFLLNDDNGFNTGFIISPRTLETLSQIHIHFLKNRFIISILALFLLVVYKLIYISE